MNLGQVFTFFLSNIGLEQSLMRWTLSNNLLMTTYHLLTKRGFSTGVINLLCILKV